MQAILRKVNTKLPFTIQGQSTYVLLSPNVTLFHPSTNNSQVTGHFEFSSISLDGSTFAIYLQFCLFPLSNSHKNPNFFCEDCQRD